MAKSVEQVMAGLKARLGETVEMVEGALQPTVYVSPDRLAQALTWIKGEGMDFLADLTAADCEEHFEVVYHLMSLADCGLLRVKARLPKDAPRVESVVPLWAAANVQEREVYDMLGIEFEGHPEMKRILCPDDFEGYPLRKDFKLDTSARERC